MILGILFCAALALVATLAGNVQHIMGPPLIGMFLGMIFSQRFPAPSSQNSGRCILFG